jgi:hypothetical protein
MAVGTPQNWHTAFDYGGIWGLKLTQRRFWEAMVENNDLVFFYATSPISGVVGYGLLRAKLQQNSPLWPDERVRNEIIWPLRFEFDVLSCLNPASWGSQRISSDDLKVRARSGYQALEPSKAQALIVALPAVVPGALVAASPIGPRARPIVPPAGPPTGDLHQQTQTLLAEIGQLQRYLSETEYPLENRRLDVVWRRVQRAVPSYVFEVQVSGNLTDAMGKLKQAYETWNSHVFLVGKEEHRRPVAELSSGMFHEIQHRLKFVDVRQVQELHARKLAYREFENQLGILG